MEFHNLRETDFSIKNIFINRQNWKAGEIHDYSAFGRERNLVHLITSGSRSYHIDDRKFVLNSGELLFIPDKTKYITVTNGSCSGIGVCFDLAVGDKKLEIVRDVYHCRTESFSNYTQLFSELLAIPNGHASLHRMTLMWKLLDMLISEHEDHSELFKMISPAIGYIKEHCRENLAVADYAALCHLSESHFRRKFREYTGMSPLEYRDSVRFEKAEKLYSDGFTVTRIADELGFCDASYLRRLYKRRTGKNFRECKLPGII